MRPVTIRPADTIWHEQGGWFDARWHLSFDRYRDPENDGVGALRVFNDDRIIAGAEWPLHPHASHPRTTGTTKRRMRRVRHGR